MDDIKKIDLKKLLNYIKKNCEKIIDDYSISKNIDITIDQKLNELENIICNVDGIRELLDDFDDGKIMDLFSLYYKKYNIENIININMEKIIKEYNISPINPLRLYDAKENKVIKNTLNKTYITISHRWNIDDKNMDINKNKKLNKMKSIYEKNNELRYYWIDTTCINQNDIKEKEEEIKNMKYYYKNSLMTIILNDIDILEKQIYAINTIVIIFTVINKNDNVSNNSILLFLFHIMSDLKFNDDWHERMWTLQETILNKYVFIYVNGFLPLSLLCTLCINIPKIITYEYEEGTLLHLCLQIKDSKDLYNIGEILNLTLYRECSLPQDKIYSILGLIDNRISNNIKVNYKFGTKKIYIDLFKEAIKINDISWLNIVLGITSSPVDILHKKIIINNDKLYFKSYVIKNLLKLSNEKNRINFLKKWLDVNNITYDEEIIKQLYSSDSSIDSSVDNDMFSDSLYNMSAITNILLDIEEYNLITLDNNIIGMINYNINDINDETDFILNNYKGLPSDWWDCVIIKNNKAVGHGIINIDKKYCVEKDIEIVLDF